MQVIETALTETERFVLTGLSHLAHGLAVQGPDNEGWRKDADSLVRMGFASNILGWYSLTDAGRSQLRSNLS